MESYQPEPYQSREGEPPRLLVERMRRGIDRYDTTMRQIKDVAMWGRQFNGMREQTHVAAALAHLFIALDMGLAREGRARIEKTVDEYELAVRGWLVDPANEYYGASVHCYSQFTDVAAPERRDPHRVATPDSLSDYFVDLRELTRQGVAARGTPQAP